MYRSVCVASSLVGGCEVTDGSDGGERLPTACVMEITFRAGSYQVRGRSVTAMIMAVSWCPGDAPLALVLRQWRKRSCG